MPVIFVYCVDDYLNTSISPSPAILAGFAMEMGGGAGQSAAEAGKEPFFVKDPRKAMRVFFERYGEEPEYSHEERTINKQR